MSIESVAKDSAKFSTLVSGLPALGRSRSLWLTLALLVLTLASVGALIERPLNPADQAAAGGWLNRLLYPVERNAPLPRIDCDLNAVYALDAQNVWAVGNLGLIVHSTDGGRTWEQQRIPAPTPQPSPQPTASATPANNNTATITNTNALTSNHRVTAHRPVGQQGLRGGGNTNRSRGNTNIPFGRNVNNANEDFAHAAAPSAAEPAGQNANTSTNFNGGTTTRRRGRQSNRNTGSQTGGTGRRPPRVTNSQTNTANTNTANTQPTPGPTVNTSPTPNAAPTPQATPLPEDLVAIIFKDAQHGWTAGRKGTLYATDDGGQHWSQRTQNFAQANAPDPNVITFEVIGDVFELTNEGDLNRSRTYSPVNTNSVAASVSSYRSLTETVELPGSSNSNSNSDRLHASGHPVLRGTNQDLRAINGHHAIGWVVGRNGTILHTTDRGQTWQTQTSGAQSQLNDVYFLPDDQHGWAVGYDGTILGTSDGGAHWVREATSKNDPPTGAYGLSLPGWYFLSWLLAGLCLVPVFRRPVDPLPEDESVADVLVSDRPLEAGDPDPLQFQAVALGLSRFLRNEKTLPPLTIAVTGEWGTGKSSLMNLLRADLRAYGFRPVWFNAWHHQKEEHLLAALLQNIRLQAVPRWWRPGGIMFRARLLLIRGWRHWLPVLLLLFIAALLFSYSIELVRTGDALPADPVKSFLNFFNPTAQAALTPRLALVVSVVSIIVALWKGVTAFGVNPANLLASVSRGWWLRDLDAETSFRKKFADEFRDVTQALGARSMIIFIDDLDRCRPENVLDTLEAVNFLVTSGDCFVVIGMARERVERVIGLSFKDVAEEVLDGASQHAAEAAHAEETPTGVSGNGTVAAAANEGKLKRAEFARQYLDKLINIEVPVPRPTDAQSCALLVAPPLQPPPALIRRWQQIRALALSVWPVVMAALVLLAGSSAGLFVQQYLHAHTPHEHGTNVSFYAKVIGSTEVPAPNEANAALQRDQELYAKDEISRQQLDEAVAAARTDNANVNNNANTTPTPEYELRRQTQKAELSAAGAARRSAFSYWPLSLVGLLLLFAVGWLLTRRPNLVVKDSKEFEDALRIWHPVIFTRQRTPRALKRFMNRVRYLAMRQRPVRADRSLWERALNALAHRFGIELARAQPRDDAPAIPEATLVALAAVQQFDPDLLADEQHFQQRIINNIIPVEQSRDGWALLRAAKEAHAQRFGQWPALQRYRTAFLKMSADIRVN